MNRPGIITVATLAAGLASGCATVGGLEHAEGAGEVSYYRASPDSVFAASVIALSDLDLRIARLDRSGRFVAAEEGVGMWSYGEVVGVHVRCSDRDPGVSRAEVVSRKRLGTNVLAKNWENEVLAHIDAQFTGAARLVGGSENFPPPAISTAELHACVQEAEDHPRVLDQRTRDRDVRECREDGAGDSRVTTACLRRREAEREAVPIEPDMTALNACLQAAKKSFP